ncbi:MAG: hypothetical protein K8R53_06820 [Bacteroidales bacterium]|nr:hypothetical protein [Bacteroidales bacterium]
MGLLDQLLLKLHESRRRYRNGEISESEFIKIRRQSHNERLKINSQIKALKNDVKKSLSQGKDDADHAMQIFEQANLLGDFQIDPRDEYTPCERRGGVFVLPEDCIEYSQDKSKANKCKNCENLEIVKKLLEEPMTEKKTIVKKDKEVNPVDDEKLINNAVQFINEKANETLYKGSIQIGEYILKKFFEGDPALASSKNPKKQQSFNKLYAHDDLIVHPNQLGLMVRVASQEQYFIEKKIDTRTLSYTHKASLVKVDNGLKKTNMVKKCIKEEWNTRQLEETIKKYLKSLPSSAKPSLIRTTKKYITKMDDVLKTVEDTKLDFDADDISKMTGKKREDLKTYLSDLEAKAKEGMDRSKAVSERCSKALEELAKIETEKKKTPVKRGRPVKKK